METYSNYREIRPYIKSNYNEEPIDLTNGNINVNFNVVVNRRKQQSQQLQQQQQQQQYLQQQENNKNKYEEVLKSAKSLFTKRTRTLYHWMYPNIPKQQIKSAVANCWEHLTEAEKQYYISQVRFTFAQGNLMVNPQLNDLKLHETMQGSEADLSIASDNNNNNDKSNDKKYRKRPGRPVGIKNKRFCTSTVVSDDFKDDPELFKEMKQFAISFDHFKS